MTWDRDVISIVAMLSGFLMLFWYTPIVWRERCNLDKHKAAFYVICCCFAFGPATNLEEPYLWIGHVTHIPNLSWLMSFWVLIVGHYCLRILMSAMLNIDMSGLKTLGYAVATFMLLQALIFFLGGVAFSSPNLARANARTLSELIFMNSLYVFQIVIFVDATITTLKIATRNSSLELRTRSGILCIEVMSAVAYSVLRMFQTITAYLFLPIDTRFANVIQMMLWITFFVPLTAWPLMVIPTQWFDFFLQARQLYHLNYLYRRTSNDCGMSLSVPPPGLWAQAKQTKFYVNALVVFMLDIKWLTKHDRLVLKDEELAMAIQDINDTLPQKQFVTECINQSKRLKRQVRMSIRNVKTKSYGEQVS